MARHEEFPAASNALKVRVLLPTSSGMAAAVQPVVPVAVPEAPPDVDHFTETTPTLSAAVPLHVMTAADVATMVNAGDVIFSEGGTVSGVPGAGVPPAGGDPVDGGVPADGGDPADGGVPDEGVDGGCAVGGGASSRLPYRSRIPAMSSAVSPVVSR